MSVVLVFATSVLPNGEVLRAHPAKLDGSCKRIVAYNNGACPRCLY